MYFKLSVRNIRRSVRDYAIYFVTLVFGVAVFYAFNSIGSQKILFDLEAGASGDMFELTQELISMFSAVIAFVLGFLIVYANRFLIKRRKHEFGIYLTLGMNPGDVSRIVLYETAIVGLVSLVVGLVCGVLLSQALSFVTAGLFNLNMTTYQFVFSKEAFVITLACFVVIYVVVALFNLRSVRSYKLIDLLSASTKNERNPVRNPWACLAVFVVAVGIIAAAYWQLSENGMVELDEQFTLATVLMLVGTLLFFWSLAGFTIALLTRLRGVYLRGLAVFTVRQIASKVNTAFVSLWVVCVMLFIAITTFSTGMGLIEVFCGGIERATPYDATMRADIYFNASNPQSSLRPDSDSPKDRADALAAEKPEVYAEGESYNWNMEAKLRDVIPNWDDIVRTAVQVDMWEVPRCKYAPLLDETGMSSGLSDTDTSIRESNLNVMSLSQFNALCELLGQKTYALEDDQYLIANNMATFDDIARAAARQGVELDMCGHRLSAVDDVASVQLFNSSMEGTALDIVVPDYLVAELRGAGAIPLQSYLNVAYVTPGYEGDQALAKALALAFPLEGAQDLEGGYAHADDSYTRGLWPTTSVYTHVEMVSQSDGLRMMITYLALYIGFVFLIATAAILAIQQLSEAADSQPRYKLLSRLGCDSRMLSRSLFTQVLVYFLAPLLVAVCHTACAITVLSDNLFTALGTPVQGPILMAAGFTLLIYGGYFLVTYFTSRSIVRQATQV